MFKTHFLKVYPPIWFLVLFIFVSLDIATKKIVTNNLNFNLSYTQVQYVNSNDSNAALVQNPNKTGIDNINLIGKDGSIARFRLLFNDRFIFGLGPSISYLSIIITFFATLFLFLYHWYVPNLGYSFAWLLVFSGALGNLIDKLFIKSLSTREWVFSLWPKKGYVSGVVDFIDCIWFGWEDAPFFLDFLLLKHSRWPTFNIADSCIVVGMCLLVYSVYKAGNTLEIEPNKKQESNS